MVTIKDLPDKGELETFIKSHLDYDIEVTEIDTEIYLEDVYGLVATSKIAANIINNNKESNGTTNEKN